MTDLKRTIRIDRLDGDPGDDSAVIQRVLGAYGGGDHGRPGIGDGSDPAIPTRAVRRVVSRESGAVCEAAVIAMTAFELIAR